MPRLTLDTNICIHAIKRNKSESFAASKGLGRPWVGPCGDGRTDAHLSIEENVPKLVNVLLRKEGNARL